METKRESSPDRPAALPRRLAIGGGLVAALLLAGSAYLRLGAGAGQGGDAPLFGGPLTLQSASGSVTNATFRGRYKLVYFGYTFCPDVCPTTLSTIAQALGRLGHRADHVQVLFITVDPARDTPGVMAAYTQAISPRILGLTGTPAQIAQAAAEYHVYYRVHPPAGGDGNYTVDHSSVVYMQAPDDTALALIPADAPADQMAADIGKYLPDES